MNHKLTLIRLALSLLIVAFLVSEVSSSPFVPLEWQQSIKAGELEGQRKHVEWARDLDGDFIDDSFAELSPYSRTDVLVQLNDCACEEDLYERFGMYGNIKKIGVLIAYVYLQNVWVGNLPELAKDPLVAALERPVDGKIMLDTSTRTVRQRASESYTPETFQEAYGFDGSNINIAIVDSGVDDDHDGLSGKYIEDGGGYNALTNTEENPDDDNSFLDTFHGTHVAGIAMGMGVGPGCRDADDGSIPNNCAGMAPGASLIDVKVANDVGFVPVWAALAGIEWIWEDGRADVVNMSFDFGVNDDGTSTLSKAVNTLVANDMAVAVAVGGSGENLIGPGAAAALAVTVGCSDDLGTVDRAFDVMYEGSNFGPIEDSTLTIGMLKPDIVAPGVSISSIKGDTIDEYHQLTGVSMSTAHVAGAMALLLAMSPDLPPGAMKDLLRKSAYVTLAHFEDGPYDPFVDPVYNEYWGMGLLDVFEAGALLEYGITDISFSNCISENPYYPTTRRCLISDGPPYANDTDIVLDTDPPVMGELNHIFIHIENRGPSMAEKIVVSVGVKEVGIGMKEFYGVGSKEVDSLGVLESTTVTFPWTPSDDAHQCIQATIDYGFDTEYWNNTTQRNLYPLPSSSMSKATFRVENPFNETASIRLEYIPDHSGQQYFHIANRPPTHFVLEPGDCPQLAEVHFMPNEPNLPVGTTGTFDIHPMAYTESHPNGIELSGVVFKLTTVAAGLQRAYSCARHQSEGEINISLALAGRPTSDPRREAKKIRAVFDVQITPLKGISLEQAIKISSYKGNPIPSFTAFFEDNESGNPWGTHLVIEFAQPLKNEDLYTFDFSLFSDMDGDPLKGDRDFQLRVLQGDAYNSGSVASSDVWFVRSRINQKVEFGNTSRSDVNLTGTITGTDISFIRSRIGSIAP